MCSKQGVDRWAENTPDHLFYMHEIKRAFPDALFIHVIRDGRDVALSLDKIGWIRSMPWDKSPSWIAGARFWDWAVRKGRRLGRALGQDYIEVCFEDLVLRPKETLSKIGAFIHEELDHDRIQENSIGAIRKPNTVFQNSSAGSKSGPIGRWEKALSASEVAQLESAIGCLLRELGYTLATQELNPDFSGKLMRLSYDSLFETKLWLKSRTPLGRFIRAGLIRGDTDLPA
jgi:hypothetical protein